MPDSTFSTLGCYSQLLHNTLLWYRYVKSSTPPNGCDVRIKQVHLIFLCDKAVSLGARWMHASQIDATLHHRLVWCSLTRRNCRACVESVESPTHIVPLGNQWETQFLQAIDSSVISLCKGLLAACDANRWSLIAEETAQPHAVRPIWNSNQCIHLLHLRSHADNRGRETLTL